MYPRYTRYFIEASLICEFLYFFLGDSWISTDGAVDIKVGSIVRMRLIGVAINAGEISAIGSINEPALGQIA